MPALQMHWKPEKQKEICWAVDPELLHLDFSNKYRSQCRRYEQTSIGLCRHCYHILFGRLPARGK